MLCDMDSNVSYTSFYSLILGLIGAGRKSTPSLAQHLIIELDQITQKFAATNNPNPIRLLLNSGCCLRKIL